MFAVQFDGLRLYKNTLPIKNVNFERMEFFNFRSRSIQESAVGGASSSTTAPYTLNGLRGDGQVVGVIDSGLDVTSCYFSDHSGTSVTPSDFSAPVTNLGYRKVVQYVYCMNGACGDTFDQVGGHGTHVSGTIVGCIDGADISASKTLRRRT